MNKTDGLMQVDVHDRACPKFIYSMHNDMFTKHHFCSSGRPGQSNPKQNPPAPVGAKGRVFPEALATGSFGRACLSGGTSNR